MDRPGNINLKMLTTWTVPTNGLLHEQIWAPIHNKRWTNHCNGYGIQYLYVMRGRLRGEAGGGKEGKKEKGGGECERVLQDLTIRGRTLRRAMELGTE